MHSCRPPSRLTGWLEERYSLLVSTNTASTAMSAYLNIG